uniref:Uncharacterized protein n=1 Tax=Arundo donax TaxID=35708 RepID=A0A0A9HAK7_ARUDO
MTAPRRRCVLRLPTSPTCSTAHRLHPVAAGPTCHPSSPRQSPKAPT